jgi:hypothetical protein
LVAECEGPGQDPALRFQAAMLRQEDLLDTVANDFIGTPGTTPEEALAAYRRDHLWAPD